MPTLTFDPEKHEYRLDGVKLIGVTTVLREAKLYDFYGLSGYYAERGTAIHTVTELDDKGALNEAANDIVNPVIPYLDAWRKFKDETGVEVLQTEEAVFHPIYRYAGTLDRRVLWRGREGIIDLKSGLKAPWHTLQTAAYAKTFNRPLLRFSLYLRQNGTYELDEHKDPDDWEIFKAALLLVNWKKKNGTVKQ